MEVNIFNKIAVFGNILKSNGVRAFVVGKDRYAF